jgi:hypothetical protein
MHRLVEEELLDLAGCVPERFGQAVCFKKKTQTVAGKSQKMWLKLRKIGTC